MDEIEKQSEFYFIFNQKQIDVSRLVTVQADEKLIDGILSDLFKGTDVNYLILDRKILLTTGEKDAGLKLLATESYNLQQQNRITGTVLEATSGQPMVGVNVIVKGTTQGAITDENGKYVLTSADMNATLSFSFIGFLTLELPIEGKLIVDARMHSELTGLDEVVVVGYGTQKAATVTGSISAVKAESLRASSTTNLSNSFAGRLPGLVVVTRSGEPGNDNSTLRIRGSNTLGDNSPLIVIDGIANRSMQRINPGDIESITVLKDASAAIYGAQAANGVILITTKRGELGKSKVSLTFNQGWSMPTVLPEMADATTYATMLNEIDVYAGRSPRYTAEQVQKYADGSDPWAYPNTDWIGSTFKPSAMQQTANFSVTGGFESLKYFVSLGGNYQDAIYEKSATNYSQFNFRSNIDGKISKNINLSLDIAGRQENRNYPTRSASSIFSTLMRSYPTQQAYWPTGENGPDLENGSNPVVITTNQTGYDKDIRYIFESNLKLNITIPWVKGLSVTANGSVDKNIQNRKVWETPWYLYSWNGTSYDANGIPVLTKGKKGLPDPQLSQSLSDGSRSTFNGLVNYKRVFKEKHDFSILFGSEMISGESSTFSAFRKYFVSTAVDQMFAGGDLEKNNSGSADVSARLNYFGRANYAYNSRYLAEFVWRVDGSYIFPEAKRFGFFPGVSLGWRVSEENFWKDNISIVNYFKLRGSWGQTGNDRIAAYQYLASYGYNSATSGIYVFNNTGENKILSELRIPNPEVTWEVANQSNIGFDAQMLNGSLTFSGDYFYNLRTNILWPRNASVPASTGLTLPRENIGKVANQGIEFTFGYTNRFGEFKYDVSLNGGYQENKIVFWDETPGVPDYQKSTGHPMNSELYYEAIGIFRDQAAVDAYPHWAGARPGDVIFKDLNEDGKIDGLDRKMNYKTNLPTFTGGLNLNLEYRNFYSAIFIQWATGAVTNNYYEMQGEAGNFRAADANGRWTVDNIDATKPRTWNRYSEYWRDNENNTYWLVNTDYVRLKNFEVGYNVPSINKLGISGLRIYLNGLNLITLDKIDDFDPESTSATSYPLNKVFNIGVNMTF
ncbi:MAG: TonB-dependent receptor [Bacteroidales bacterium]|nr:TonB-dependent receptor [Bacteroidales bacterium]MBK7628603.1 TonB-dependent receptor [Bacteroidales bacterium]